MNLPIMSYRQKAYIIDDHTLFATSFSSILEQLKFFESIKNFSKEEDLIAHLSKFPPQTKTYIFTDYYLEDRTIVPYLSILKNISKYISIIVVSSISNPVLIQNIMESDIDAILSKSSGIDELLAAIRAVDDKEIFADAFIKKILDKNVANNVLPFSKRELEILSIFAQGLSVQATADKIHLSKHTIVTHRRKMMAKTNTNSITELLAYARKIELI